ncbi:hypothetical protein ABZT03_27775 [Streptomyces sp. NPDC005574]|uniref:hypothetical protein n=1 Tax=Streptomyces sp. NPDC005574 TaxID=3156891 RepID=UPI0033B24120
MRQQDVPGGLRARLREAAEAHEPDRAVILARVERGMSGQGRPGHRATRPRVWGWARVVSATAAVAGMLAVGGYAVASAVKEDAEPQRTVTVTATPAPSPDATSRPPRPSVRPTPSGPASPKAVDSSPARTPSAGPSAPVVPSGGGEEDGPLQSDGSVDPHSNDFWAQSDVTIRTSVPLTALTVRLSVAQSGGVDSTGAWRSLPEDDFTLTVGERDGFLVYTWELRQGRTVPKGEWVFAGQYDHDRGGRDAKDDGYAVTATAAGGHRAVSGDFAAHPGDGDGGDDG